MHPTQFPELNQVLNQLTSRIKNILESDFIGLYLQGSLAVGGFDQYSDVDFVIAIERELTPPQVDALQVMHDQVYALDSEWAKHLEGSYFPREILGNHSTVGADLWYLEHGARAITRSDHCNTLVVRWTVRQKGVTLAGPPPDALMDPIPTQELRAEIFATINDWGGEILANQDRFNNHYYQGFIVLSYARMLHDLYRGHLGSKQEGAEWAKSVLDPSWSPLIDGAWSARPDPATKIRQPPDPQDFAKTLQFVEHIIAQSRLFYITSP
jgi:hypothetical protein